MRSTFWPNRIFERQSSHNRHTGLKFSSKREKSALSMKIVQNALFRSCAARFGQIAFLRAKLLKIVTLSQILAKTGKQCAFHENCTKRSFQLTRSTFWPNRIFERQSSKNRYTCLKFSPKRQHNALFMKILQNALFRSCAARFGQIAFLSGKDLTILSLASNSLQKGNTVRFLWKFYKTLFPGHAQHVLAKSHFWASKLSKSWNWPQILFKTGKQCAFHVNCTKRSFQVMRSTFWPNRIFERQSSHNRHTGLKFSSKRENCALSMKIVQNYLFRSCAARFGQIAFLRVKLLKIVTLVSISRQNRKTGRFPWKLYKSLFYDHAPHVLAKRHFWASKFLKSWNWPQILFKTRKQCPFLETCTKRSFPVMRSTFWPNRICERQSCQNRHTGLKFSPKTENSALFIKIVQNALFRSCAARFGQIAFLSVKFLTIVTLASNSLRKGNTVRFSWKLYKTLF